MNRVDAARAVWRRSSRSGGGNGGHGQCVEAAAVWRRSGRSGGGGNGASQCVEAAALWREGNHSDASNGGGRCVEAADFRTAVGLRDSKNPDGPVLVVDRAGWRRFVAVIKDGSLDRA